MRVKLQALATLTYFKNAQAQAAEEMPDRISLHLPPSEEKNDRILFTVTDAVTVPGVKQSASPSNAATKH